MLEYNTLRTINGMGSFVASLIILFIGITLMHRGYAERRRAIET